MTPKALRLAQSIRCQSGYTRRTKWSRSSYTLCAMSVGVLAPSCLRQLSAIARPQRRWHQTNRLDFVLSLKNNRQNIELATETFERPDGWLSILTLSSKVKSTPFTGTKLPRCTGMKFPRITSTNYASSSLLVAVAQLFSFQ